jgi:iron complex outermembrane recepter protein
VAAGCRLPGVPNASMFAEVAWKSAGGKLDAAVETIANSKVYADDANRDIPAPGYGTVNARVQAKQQFGGWQLKQFARLNNLSDKRYIGSVIVGDANKRYYEAAPGRNWLLGASAQYQF